jgi:hypothetical protein
MPKFKLYAAADGIFTVEVEAKDYDDACLKAEELEWELEGSPEIGETYLIKNLDTDEQREYM